MDRASNVQCVTGPEAINMGAQWILIRVYFNRGGTIKKVGRQGVGSGEGTRFTPQRGRNRKHTASCAHRLPLPVFAV